MNELSVFVAKGWRGFVSVEREKKEFCNQGQRFPPNTPEYC